MTPKVRAYILETIASDPGLQQTELVFLRMFGRSCHIPQSTDQQVCTLTLSCYSVSGGDLASSTTAKLPLSGHALQNLFWALIGQHQVHRICFSPGVLHLCRYHMQKLNLQATLINIYIH